MNNIIEDLYVKYYKTAYIYTFSLCKNKELTEDIVSEAFEKAILTIHVEKKHFKYWLLVVCKNCWFDQLRKNKKLMPELLNENQWVENEIVVEKIMEKENNRVLFKAILQLPEKYQEVLILHYYADIPLVEIEKIMKLSKTNTKTLIYRARVKLRKVLEEAGYEY